jgi:hypothetical protein
VKEVKGKLLIAVGSIILFIVMLIATKSILIALFFLVMPWVLVIQRYIRKQQLARTIYVEQTRKRKRW